VAVVSFWARFPRVPTRSLMAPFFFRKGANVWKLIRRRVLTVQGSGSALLPPIFVFISVSEQTFTAFSSPARSSPKPGHRLLVCLFVLRY